MLLFVTIQAKFLTHSSKECPNSEIKMSSQNLEDCSKSLNRMVELQINIKDFQLL